MVGCWEKKGGEEVGAWLVHDHVEVLWWVFANTLCVPATQWTACVPATHTRTLPRAMHGHPRLLSTGLGTGGAAAEAALARRLMALRPLPMSALVGGPGEGPQLLQLVAVSDSLDYLATCIRSMETTHLQHTEDEVRQRGV